MVKLVNHKQMLEHPTLPGSLRFYVCVFKKWSINHLPQRQWSVNTNLETEVMCHVGPGLSGSPRVLVHCSNDLFQENYNTPLQHTPGNPPSQL